MAEQAKAETAEQQAPNTIVVDMGKQKRKKVKKLRKGEGPLMARVQDVIAELQADGTVDANAQTVVVVVREKPRNLMDQDPILRLLR